MHYVTPTLKNTKHKHIYKPHRTIYPDVMRQLPALDASKVSSHRTVIMILIILCMHAHSTTTYHITRSARSFPLVSYKFESSSRGTKKTKILTSSVLELDHLEMGKRVTEGVCPGESRANPGFDKRASITPYDRSHYVAPCPSPQQWTHHVFIATVLCCPSCWFFWVICFTMSSGL